MTKWADPADVADKAGSWSEAQLDCRLMGHAWSQAPMIFLEEIDGVLLVRQDCPTGCGVGREFYVSRRRGRDTTSTRMDYSSPEAQEYLMKGKGRVDAQGKAVIWQERLMNVPVVKKGTQ